MKAEKHKKGSRRCKVCLDLRGHAAFAKDSTTCKRCETTIAVINSEEGIVTLKLCNQCNQEKDACKEFGVHNQTQVFNSKCKKCRQDYALDYSRTVLGYLRPIRCKKSFVFEGKRICDKCETIRPVEHFHKNRVICKPCVGSPIDEKEKAQRLQERIDSGFYNKNTVNFRPLNEAGEMQCKRCNKFKHLNKFDIDVRVKSSYGHRSICKECRGGKVPSKGKKEFIKYFNEHKGEIFNES